MATEASELPQHAGEHITVTTPDGDTASTYHAGDLITVTTPDGDTASIMSGVSSMGASDRSEKPLYQPSPLRGAGYGWGLGWRDQAGIPRQRMNVDDADKASIIDEKEGLENPSFAFLLKYHGALGVGERGTKARDSAVAIIDQLKAVKGRPVRLQVDINEIVILSSTSGVVAKYAVCSVATCTMSDDQTYVAFIGTEDGRACLSRHNSMSSDTGGESDATKMRTSSTEAFTIEKSAAIHTCHVFSNESGGSTVGVARALAVLFRAAYKNFVTRAKDRDVAVGYTGLHWAAKAGQENLVSMWLRAGADVNARSRGGYTPLHLAALHNHIPVIKMLLAAGGDPSALDHGGRSPKDLVPLVARQPQQRPNPSQKSLSANPPAAASASPSERRQPLVTIRSGTFDGGIKQTAIESVSPASNRPEEYQMRRMTTVASTSRLSDDVRARTASFAGKPSSPLSSPRSMSFLGGKKKSEWVAVARAQQVVKGTDSAPGTPVTARKGGDEHSPKGGDEQSPKGGDEQSPKGGDEQSPEGDGHGHSATAVARDDAAAAAAAAAAGVDAGVDSASSETDAEKSVSNIAASPREDASGVDDTGVGDAPAAHNDDAVDIDSAPVTLSSGVADGEEDGGGGETEKGRVASVPDLTVTADNNKPGTRDSIVLGDAHEHSEV